MTEPDFPATNDGADAAVRAGNRRRLRTATATLGSALAVVLVVVAAPWQGPSGRESLTPATTVTSPPPNSATVPSRTTTPIAAVPSPTAFPAPPGTTAGPAIAAPSPTATVGAPTRRTGSPQRSPITRGTSTIGMTDLCGDDQTDAAQGWCIRYAGPTTVRRGHPVVLTEVLCRLGSYPAASVSFGSTREITMNVQGNGVVWEAGQGERYSSPGRTVSLPPGTCLTWSSTWDTRGPDGFLVLPGSYAVGTGVDSSSASFATGFADLTVTD